MTTYDVILPALINTLPYNNREACTVCQFCVGFTCLVDAKAGTQNTLLPRALATGRCELVAHAMVTRVELDGRGRVNGVTYATADGEMVRAKSRVVVLAAGAIETATVKFNHGNTGLVGGGMLADEFIVPVAWATTWWRRQWSIAGAGSMGTKNLYVMDGSVHVTNGGFNPVLTLLALAYRAAEHLAQPGV